MSSDTQGPQPMANTVAAPGHSQPPRQMPVFALSGVPDVLRPVFGEFGFLNPVLAAGAMAISSVTVVANSLRLRGLVDRHGG